MAALYEEGFVVRVPSWHRLENEVFTDYPGRDLAFRTAGHDFTVVETGNGNERRDLTEEEFNRFKVDRNADIVRVGGVWKVYDHRAEKKGLYIEQLRDGVPGPVHGNFIEVAGGSYTVVQNETAWDLLDAILSDPEINKTLKLNYETGATLDDGKLCFVTATLDDPFQVEGDNSAVWPYIAMNWRHDGLGALRIINTSVREVCANTVNMAEAEADKSGRTFTFKHTKNVHERIEDAKLAIQGIAVAHHDFAELAEELGKIEVTEKQRDEFVLGMIPDVPAMLTSERVQNNIANERLKIRNAFASRTIPEAHKLTGWGLYNAGVEYLDYLRDFRSPDTLVKRTLLRPEPFKKKLVPLIREVAGIAA